MKTVPYASTDGNLMYVMLCTSPYIYYSVAPLLGIRKNLVDQYSDERRKC